MLEQLVTTFAKDPFNGVGQATWTVPGTYQWVVPDDVNSICFLLVGPGQQGEVNGANAFGGSGGGVRWKNDVTVVPGSTITVVVGKSHNNPDPTASITSTANIVSPAIAGIEKTSILGLQAGCYDQGTTLISTAPEGGKGGAYDVTGYNKLNNGGSAGAMNVFNGSHGGTTPNRGLNVISASFVNRSGNWGAVAGGGGSAIPKAQNGGINNQVWLGAHGAARIIWGKGRKYPFTKVNDQ